MKRGHIRNGDTVTVAHVEGDKTVTYGNARRVGHDSTVTIFVAHASDVGRDRLVYVTDSDTVTRA